MDGMHYGNLWNKLGRQLRESASRQAWVAQHAATLERLVVSTSTHLRTCGAQPLANIAHGAAHVGLPAGLAADLFRAAAEAAEPELARWSPRHLANLSWACAHAGHGGGARFYAALAAASRPQLAAFNPLELGMLAAAFAKAEQRAFTRDLCRAVRRCAAALGPQELRADRYLVITPQELLPATSPTRCLATSPPRCLAASTARHRSGCEPPTAPTLTGSSPPRRTQLHYRYATVTAARHRDGNSYIAVTGPLQELATVTGTVTLPLHDRYRSSPQWPMLS